MHSVELSFCKSAQWYELSNMNMDASIVLCQDRSAFDQTLSGKSNKQNSLMSSTNFLNEKKEITSAILMAGLH